MIIRRDTEKPLDNSPLPGINILPERFNTGTVMSEQEKEAEKNIPADRSVKF